MSAGIYLMIGAWFAVAATCIWLAFLIVDDLLRCVRYALRRRRAHRAPARPERPGRDAGEAFDWPRKKAAA